MRHFPHHLTWKRLAQAGAALPTELRKQLQVALLVYTSEHHNHWATSHAINSNGYWKPTPEQRAELDAEWARRLAANRANTRALQLAVHEALGDIDEPQDLIECAATLAPR